jgi:hypothetical protein
LATVSTTTARNAAGQKVGSFWAGIRGKDAEGQETASNRLWLPAAAVFILVRLLVFLPGEINTFAASHYLFSYTNGFQKRALVGAVLGLSFNYLTADLIYALSLGVLMALAIALLAFVRRPLLMSKEMLGLGLVLLGAPAVLPHFAYAIGYFDPILIICALLTLAILDSTLVGWLKLSLALIPCVIGVLTHESYALNAFPLILACTLVSPKSEKMPIVILTGAVCVMTVMVQAFGQPSIPVDQYMSHAAVRTDVVLDLEAFQLLYFHLRENFIYLAQHYSSMMTVARLVAGLIVPIPYFLLLADLFRLMTQAVGISRRRILVLGVCLLAPLLLALVGFDVLRWVSFACLNLSLLIFACIRSDDSGRVRDALTRYVHSARFWGLALFSYTLGPLHVVDGNGIATGIHALAHGLALVRW